jgi:hypothetical protein
VDLVLSVVAEELSDRPESSDVRFACDFESGEWFRQWGVANSPHPTQTALADANQANALYMITERPSRKT